MTWTQSQKEYCLALLDRNLNLEENWDGNQARKPSSLAIKEIEKLLVRIYETLNLSPRLPIIDVLSNGGIALLWREEHQELSFSVSILTGYHPFYYLQTTGSDWKYRKEEGFLESSEKLLSLLKKVNALK